MSKIQLGDKVKDVVSGMTGIVTGITDHLHGCRRMLIEPDKLKTDGTLADAWVMDEYRLKVVKAGVIKPQAIPAAEKTGGPITRVPR